MSWTPFLWLAVTLAVLLLLERWIHRHLQGTALLLTGDREVAVALYALPLLPGVIIHELSHALAGLLLGVKVGRISFRPKMTGRRIRLGVVPVEKTDAVRSSLIGLAPLLTGCAAILLIGYWIFGLDTVGAALVASDWSGLLAGLREALRAPDAWIWAYVIFAVSNTMLPSRADRQAWAPVIIFLVLTGVVVWVTGIGPAFAERMAEPANTAVRWLALMCTFTIAVDLPFSLGILGMERLLERVKGVRVTYGE
jgi:hypothetical protein